MSSKADNGFQLKDNRFLKDGVCWYEDSFGNVARFTREQDGFRIKLYLKEEGIKARAIRVHVPIPEGEDGATLHLDYEPGRNIESESVIAAQRHIVDIINRWIYMLEDISLLDMKSSILQAANQGTTEEDIARHKFDRIAQYEELSEVVKGLFAIK